MKRLYKIMIFLLLVFCITKAKAQDALFTQYYAAPLYLAPSYAGSTNGSRLSLNYRNQWPAIQTAFQVSSLAYDHYFPSYNSGLGVFLLRDVAGTGNLSKTNFGLQYSYNTKINREWRFRPGVQLQLSTLSVDFDKLVFYEQLRFNGNIPVNSEQVAYEKVKYLDMSVSLMAYRSDLWFGLSMDHFNTPNESMESETSPVPRRVKVFAGKKFVVKNKKKWNEETLTPSFVYQTQGEFSQLDIGLYWSKSPFVAGIWYRGIPFKKYDRKYISNDAIVFLVGYQLKDIKFGYSYDLTISRLYADSWGSHEISIIYEFLQDQKPKKRKYVIIPCPKF